MKKIFLLLSFIFLFTSCEQIITEGDFSSSTKYPAKVGYEWEYNTTWKFEFYDSTGHIDSTSFENLGNTIVRVTKERDVVGIFTDLIRFESYDLATSQNMNIIWYMNNDSGFYGVAYYNPGVSQPILPKQKTLAIEQLKNLIKSFGLLPNASNFIRYSSNTTDSIQYYSPIRKVLSYPLKIGSRWVELIEPFFRERFIEKREILNTISGNYNCYKLESNWSWSNLEFNDYVDLNSGLIQREIISDSMAYTPPNDPNIIRYFKSTTISKLVREKK
jgi:hypothetical protein